jgi:hypothetical protein
VKLKRQILNHGEIVWVTATPCISDDAIWFLELKNAKPNMFYVGVSNSDSDPGTHTRWYFANDGCYQNVVKMKSIPGVFESGSTYIFKMRREEKTETISQVIIQIVPSGGAAGDIHELKFLCNETDFLYPMVGLSAMGQMYEFKYPSRLIAAEVKAAEAPAEAPAPSWYNRFANTVKNTFNGGKSKITRKRLKKKDGNVTRHRKFKRAPNRSRKIHRKP